MQNLNLKQLGVIAVLTASETMRQPVCLLLTTVCIIFTAAIPLVTGHTFGDGSRLARDSGLAFQQLFGLFIVGYASCSALERERRSGTMAAVLSKPVGRGTYFIAKFLGILFVIALFSLCAGMTMLLAERAAVSYSTAGGFVVDFRSALAAIFAPVAACIVAAFINWRGRGSFQSAALLTLLLLLVLSVLGIGCFSREGAWAPYHPQLQWQILSASLAVTLGLMLLASIALTLAVRLSLVPVIFCSLGVLVLGLVVDVLLGTPGGHSLAGIISGIVPNWQNFWLSNALAGDGISFGHLVQVVFYALFYTGAVLCLGSAVFRHSEVL